MSFDVLHHKEGVGIHIQLTHAHSHYTESEFLLFYLIFCTKAYKHVKYSVEGLLSPQSFDLS